jgi:4-amino-4-deoxy-L-arabinose transferase-like glycosyltransferase
MTVRSHYHTKFILGFVLICAAQYVIAQRDVSFITYRFLPWLVQTLRLDLDYSDNLFTGIILLCLGGMYVFRALHPPALPSVLGALPLESSPGVLRFARRHMVSLLASLILFVLVLYQLNLIDPSPTPIALWIVVIGLLARLAFKYDKEAGFSLSLRLNRQDFIGIVLLVAAGLIIGTYRLQDIPNTVIGDEAGFWGRAQTIAEGQEGASFFDLGVYSYPLASSFYQALFLKILGFSLWSWRFSSVLLTILTVIPLYLFVRDQFDRRAAILSCIVFITLPYLLAFERMGYNNAQAIFPVALTVYLLYAGLQRNSLFYLCLSGIAAGVGFYTYTAGRLGLVIGIGFIGWLMITQLPARLRRRLSPEERQDAVRRRKQLVRLSVGFSLLALVTLLPHIVYTNANSPELLRYKLLESLFPNTTYARSLYSPAELFRDYPPIRFEYQEFFFRPDLYVHLLLRGVIRTMLAMHTEAVTNSHFVVAALAGPVSVVFYVTGLIIALKNRRKPQFGLLLLWFLGGLFLLSMINTFPARHQHFIPVAPVLAIFIALGMLTCADFVAGRLRTLFDRRALRPMKQPGRMPSPLWLTVLAAVLGVVLVTNLRNYFVEMPARVLPDLENIMGWDALQVQQPQHFVYVYADPDREQFIPWIILSLPTKVLYQTLSEEALSKHDFELVPGEEYVFYFPDRDSHSADIFEQAMNGIETQRKTHYDREGRIIGIAISFAAPAQS